MAVMSRNNNNNNNENNNQETDDDSQQNMTIDNNNNNMTYDRESFIHQIRLFSGLTDQELRSIEKGKEVWFEAGDKIIAEGEHDTFYVLLDGKVEVILRDGSKEAVLATFNSGDHFGELPIILGWSDHKCAAYAAKKSHLLRWSQDEFWQMIYSSPALTRQILHSMAQLLKTLETTLQNNQKLIALGSLAAGLVKLNEKLNEYNLSFQDVDKLLNVLVNVKECEFDGKKVVGNNIVKYFQSR